MLPTSFATAQVLALGRIILRADQKVQAQEEEEARVLAEFEATFGAKGVDAESKPVGKNVVGENSHE